MQISKKQSVPHAVVDTNILVRAILKPTSSDGKVYRMFLNGAILLYFSEIQIKEVERVVRYPRIKKKYQLAEDIINSFIATLFTYGKLIYPTESISICRDPDDNELLSIAKSVFHNKPIYLISADKDLLVLKGKVEGVIIVTPQEFLKSKVY